MKAGPDAKLARAELDPLVDELARRFGAGDVPVTVTLRDLSLDQRHGLADLLGVDRAPAATASILVSRLLAVLDLKSVADLRTTVESLRGTLPDRRAERLANRAAREQLWTWLHAEAAALSPSFSLSRPAASTPGALDEWVARMRAQGARGGVDAHRRRLEDALQVLRALPANGVPLAAFAQDILVNPHALDRGRRLAAIVLDAVALATGAPFAADAEAARELWESVGVAPDPLSSTVLGLGLPSNVSEPLGPWLAASAAASEPVVLTLAQLRRWPLPPLPADSALYIVENPSLVAEAASRGWSGPPLVCSSGRPTVAVVTLLRQLGASGAQLRQHADFDAAGLAITAWLVDRAGTTPWRMTAGDYLAVARDRQVETSVLGAVPATPWDPRLSTSMLDAGVVVYEEELRVELLDTMVSLG